MSVAFFNLHQSTICLPVFLLYMSFSENLAKQIKHLHFLGPDLLCWIKQRLDVIVLAEALSAADVLVKRCQCCKITAQQWTQVHQFYVIPTSERRFSVYCCGLPARLCLRRVLIIAFHVKVSTKQSSLQKYGLFIPTDRHFEQIERGEEILISKLWRDLWYISICSLFSSLQLTL